MWKPTGLQGLSQTVQGNDGSEQLHSRGRVSSGTALSNAGGGGRAEGWRPHCHRLVR